MRGWLATRSRALLNTGPAAEKQTRSATGAISREVGTQLFLSPHTIEAHLRNIFRELDACG